MADTDPIGAFDATVQGVINLLPNAVFPDSLEPGRLGVTKAQLGGYLTDVSGRVTARLVDYEKLTEEQKATVDLAARDLVHNGAASYAQSARYPEQAGRSRDGLAAVLWARFESGLDDLAELVADMVGDTNAGEGDTTGTATGAGAWTGPDPYFTDSMAF